MKPKIGDIIILGNPGKYYIILSEKKYILNRRRINKKFILCELFDIVNNQTIYEHKFKIEYFN